VQTEIKAYSLEGITEVVLGLGQQRFRGDQLARWLYLYGASDYQEMTNLPQSLRAALQEKHPLYKTQVIDKKTSKDGTRKYVVEFKDGARVETVAIPTMGSPEGLAGPLKRLTVCFSTQVGCAMACAFCATGKEGFSRNLLPGEIVDQVLMVQKDFDARVGNLVAMGQGEPFLNYENTIAALRIMNSPQGLAIGARHITVSTCGIVTGIRRLSLEPEQFTLAVSLHSADQAVRDLLMPALAGDPLSRLKEALLEYVGRTNRRVTLEYAMVDGINDTPEAFAALVGFCSGLLCHVNLLPVNPIPLAGAAGDGSPSLSRPSPLPAIQRWQGQLEEAHIPATVRHSKGADIAGACGQLKNTL